MARIFQFRIVNSFALDFQSFTTMPIYTDGDKSLVGIFLYDEYDKLQGFIAGQGHPITLNVSLGDPLFLTPIEEERGVSHAMLSVSPISINSRVFRCEPLEDEPYAKNK